MTLTAINLAEYVVEAVAGGGVLVRARPIGLFSSKPCEGCDGHPHAADGEDPCPGYTCPDCNGSGRYAGSLSEYHHQVELVASVLQQHGIDDPLPLAEALIQSNTLAKEE